MRLGKLGEKELRKYVIDKLKVTREEVILSADVGEDCAALKIPEFILVSSDPITADMSLETLGSLAVDVASNDIISGGGEPIALTAVLLMPKDSNADDIGVIIEALVKRAGELNIDVIGGHTEFTDSVIRPIVSITCIGKTERVFKKSDLKDGDKIYITKYAGLEGTVIAAQTYKGELNEDDKKTLAEFKTALSVIKEGALLRKYPSVTTLHDITEGGIIGSVAEVCSFSGMGAVVYENNIPVADVTKKICKAGNIDVYNFISSGALMFTGKNLEKAIKELEENGIKCSEIGIVTNESGVKFIRSDGSAENVSSRPDELFSYLYKAKQ